jgi:type IV pilus assembly protein PilV
MSQGPQRDGFSLIEVLVAILLVAIGLLGLAAAQIKTLQYASSSLQQTVASIQAQNVIERLWPDLCRLQQGSQPFDENFKASLKPDAELDPAGYSATVPAYDFSVSPLTNAAARPLLSVTISWTDRRQRDQSSEQLDIAAGFPWLRNGNPAGCL